jgi:hypothetical protein
MRRRIAAIVLALLVVGVPTIYTVFGKELQDRALWVRVVVGIAWLLVAAGAAWIATGRDVRLDWWMNRQADEQRRRIAAVAEKTFERLLAPGIFGIPAHYEFTVYSHKPESDLLVPSWPQDPAYDEVKTFAAGNGATGRAWSDDQFKLVVDDDVSNDKYGLTPEQQVFFADDRAVLATPVYGLDGTPLGVLTGISKVNDGHFETEEHRDTFRDLAAVVGAPLDSVADIQGA